MPLVNLPTKFGETLDCKPKFTGGLRTIGKPLCCWPSPLKGFGQRLAAWRIKPSLSYQCLGPRKKEMHEVIVACAESVEQAQKYLETGYEPIECSFGSDGIVVGALNADHHGNFSHLPPVVYVGFEHHGTKERFVVTGAPDLDSVSCIAQLAGRVILSPLQVKLIGDVDTDPIKVGDLRNKGDDGIRILRYQQTTDRMKPTSAGFAGAVKIFSDLFSSPVTKEMVEDALFYESERRVRFDKHYLHRLDSDVGIGIFSAPQWAFDLAYEMANILIAFVPNPEFLSKAAVTKYGEDVVKHLPSPALTGEQYTDVAKSVRGRVTIGAKSSVEAGKFWPTQGLKALFRALGPGWGGRETIGGSPRGKLVSYAEAERAFFIAQALARVPNEEKPTLL